MLTYKEFRKKLLTELDQRGIKFEITSMTSVNGEKERISIAFSNFTTDNAVDSDHKPETFGLYPDHEYANYLGLCESESESPVERIVDDALQIMSQLSEKVSLEYVNSFLKLRDEDIIYQLINAKKNEELLKKVPHRIVADDLAVIYRIYKTEIDENSDEKLVTSTIILNSLMEESRYTEEKLYACASVNMPKQFPIFILNVQQSEIFSLLVNGFGYSLMDAKEKVLSMPLSNPDTDYMWAISNFDERYGAATILYSDEIQRFANELEDDLVLVPSSTHEWFAYRKSDIEINEAYEDIIRETNETLVPKEQVLSDHLYIYKRSSGTLKTFEQAVQEYLERSRLYFDLIRLNSYDWDDLTLAELRSVGEIILKDHKKAFVKNPTVEEINHAETFSKNVPDGEDADTILADLCEETSMEEPGLAYDVFNTWKAAQTSHERESIEGMFLIFAGIEFGEYLERCIKETTQEGEQ